MRLSRTGLAALSLTLATTGLAVATTLTPAEAASAREIHYRQWTSGAQFNQGYFNGTRTQRGVLRLHRPKEKTRYVDPYGHPAKTYDVGRWTSRWASPGFGFTELIPSWDASTPRDTWIQVELRGRSEAGRRGSWDTVARWAAGDTRFHRTSLDAQTDDLARVAVDTWRSNYSIELTAYQLRVSLFRRSGTTASPVVDTVGAMTSDVPAVDRVRTSRPGVARGITLSVPRYSQMIHSGHYPQYGNGGEAWCSPTSTSMVLGYLKRLPRREEYAWVPRPHPNRFVDHAARMTYDYRYRGTGNWSFNAAYAAQYTDHAFVTRLRSLREAERFIKAGIPVVASVAFGRGELDGAPISATDGHLLVIVGFTAAGDVVVNDPAARKNRFVRRTYDRGQFENAWLPTSGGLVYVIRTAGHPLPGGKATNW